jgi:8-oxo-dGTP pyrophosphatase MutT (NUDIX family)
MRILLLWPPEQRDFLSTFRHFSHFGAVAGYLRRRYPEFHFKLLDGAVAKPSRDQLATEFRIGYDLVVVQVEPYNVESAQRAIDLCKRLGSARVVAFGGMCGLNPKFLLAHSGVDAVCYTGNWEYGVRYYIEYLMGHRDPSQLTDLYYRANGSVMRTPVGPMVAPEDWCLAPLDWMPVPHYDPLTNANHQREARILASRGCPFTCSFCRTSYTGTRRVIHRAPAAIVRDIAAIRARYSDDVDKYNLVAANFTANRSWALSVCRAIAAVPGQVRWCTMSRVSLLDEGLVAEMAASGCWKVGMGIETLGAAAQAGINKCFAEETVKRGVLLLRKYGIVARTCIMLGIPGQTREDILYSFLRLQEWGASIRPKEYYPFQQLTRDDLAIEDVRKFDRSEPYRNPIDGLSKELFLRLLRSGDVTPADCRPVTSAGVVLFDGTSGDPRVLLLRHCDGGWYLPRGKRMPGEELPTTATREAREETGLVVEVDVGACVGSTLDVYWSPRTGLPTAKTTHYFRATPLAGELHLSEPQWVEVRWASPTEACRLLPVNLHEIVQQAAGLDVPAGWNPPVRIIGDIRVLQDQFS